MEKLHRIGVIVLIGCAGFLFLAMVAGPERMNPWLTALLGLEPPARVLPVPVPRALEVTGRVLDAVSEAGVRRLMGQFTEHG